MIFHRKRGHVLAAIASLLMSTAAWADPIPGLYNTGLDATGNRLPGNGEVEAHYRVAGHYAHASYNGAYFLTGDAQWIGENPNGSYSGPPGSFENLAPIDFTLSFDMTGLNPATARITGRWGADNAGEMYLNGIKVSTVDLDHNFSVPTSFTITSGFKQGINVLTFRVLDAGPPGGFVVTGMSGTADKASPPAWSAGDWQAWSTTCGAATRTRTVTCISPDSGTTISDDSCLAAAKPSASETSYQTSGCSFEWKEGAYGAPAPACGATISSRTVSCVRTDGQPATDDQCPTPKPATEKPDVSYATCSYGWAADGYGAPSTTCGQGIQTRAVYCQRSDGDKVEDALCSSAGTRPETTLSSYQTSGCGYSWKASPTWNAPVPACGPTIETRDVTCERSDGQLALDASCPADTKPTTQRGTTNYSTCGYAWETTAWSDPTRTCGSSTRTRTASCHRSDGSIVDDASCTTTRPVTSETVTDYSACSYVWNYSEFGAPIAACGPTMQTRTATCVRQDGSSVDDTFCGEKDALTKSATDYSTCSFEWNAGSWTTPSTCGETTRTRVVTCLRSDGTTTTDDRCVAGSRPTAAETVNDTSACTYAWSYSEWTQPAACGPVIQTRTASCLRQDGVQADARQCATTPEVTERPGTDYTTCQFKWTTSDWSTPSACGSTTRTRQVTCTRSDGTGVSASQCEQDDRPSSSESITDTSACQYSWVQTAVSQWGACVNGTQSHTVTAECHRSDGSTVPDAMCPTSRPPTSESRSCSTPVTPTDPETSPTGGQVVFRRALQVRHN